MIKLRAFLIALCVALPLPSAAQLPVGTPPTKEAFTARVDSIVKADILPRGFPSVAIAVTRGGKPLLDQAWGVANVATGQKADPTTTYNLGSMAKQFTAALVLKLVDRGKLSLTDTIGRHLPGVPSHWDGLTIETLLNHTSGIARDFLQESHTQRDLPGDSLIAIAAKRPLDANPGTAWAYSNTGYMVLGVLVERMYGKPYRVVLQDEIARPLGLASLSSCDDASPKRAALGYVRSSDGKATARGAVRSSPYTGWAGICATAGDVAKWNNALHGGRVLSPASYTAMTTSRGAATGKYGFGLVPRKAAWGNPAIVHDGQVAGFTVHNGWYPAESLSVTVLYNALPYHEVDMSAWFATVAVGGTPRPIPPVAVIDLPVAATQGGGRPKFVGAYEISVRNRYIVTFEDGILYVTPQGGERQQLFLKSGTTYALGSSESSTTVTFHIDSEGIVTGFTAKADGGDRLLRKVK